MTDLKWAHLALIQAEDQVDSLLSNPNSCGNVNLQLFWNSACQNFSMCKRWDVLQQLHRIARGRGERFIKERLVHMYVEWITLSCFYLYLAADIATRLSWASSSSISSRLERLQSYSRCLCQNWLSILNAAMMTSQVASMLCPLWMCRNTASLVAALLGGLVDRTAKV